LTTSTDGHLKSELLNGKGQENLKIYFKGTKIISWINLREQGIFQLGIRDTEQWNLLMWNKGDTEIFKEWKENVHPLTGLQVLTIQNAFPLDSSKHSLSFYLINRVLNLRFSGGGTKVFFKKEINKGSRSSMKQMTRMAVISQ